jgi:hypothetical protein
MIKDEVGRMVLNTTTLIEYKTEQPTYFIQSGVAGFYATAEELSDLYGLLSYYFNIDAINNTVVALTEGGDDDLTSQ